LITGILSILAAMVILIAPIYIGLHFSKKSVQKRREKEQKK